MELAELEAEVRKWKRAATDAAFTAERALSRLILAEGVCEAVRSIKNQDLRNLSPTAFMQLNEAYRDWESGTTLN